MKNEMVMMLKVCVLMLRFSEDSSNFPKLTVADNLNLESIFWNGLRFIRESQILCVLMDLNFLKG